VGEKQVQTYYKRLAIKIIIDTNIAFSAILNSSGRIGKLLLLNEHFGFYSCEFLKFELHKHKKKLLGLTKYSEFLLNELEQDVLSNIQFKDETLIPENHLLLAEKIAFDVDPDDIPFVDLTMYLDGFLWTGDKKLIEGLKQKGFMQTITTAELSDLFDQLEG